jgi:hypothetical protein
VYSGKMQRTIPYFGTAKVMEIVIL